MNGYGFTEKQAVKFNSCNAVICPACGAAETHQSRVTVYDRGEDGQVVTMTIVGSGLQSTRVPNSVVDNPSPRRHGLRIAMTCEQCDDCPPLVVYQHKGFTVVEWDVR